MNRILFLFLLICTTPLSALGLWDVSIVEDGWSVGQYTSLAILPFGQPAISYYDYIDGDLEYAWFEDGEWHTTTVDSVGNVGSHTSIEILQSSRPAICYIDLTNNDLKYAELTGENPYNPSDWKITIVDPDAVAGFTGMEILTSGHPAVSYSSTNTIKYAWFDGTKWHIAVVDTVGTKGGQTSLILSLSDQPMISYYDGTNRDLKLAELVGSNPSDPDQWRKTIVDYQGNVGKYNSLGILPSGDPAISYFDESVDDLKYAWLEEGSWHTITVDAPGNVGRYCSLEILPEDGAAANCLGGVEQIDLSGQPVISYYARSGLDLKFAWFDGIEWQVCPVDTSGWTGLYTSMTILPCGQPAISYYNWNAETLKYAWFEGFGWYKTTVDRGKRQGEHTSLDISPLSGRRAISYFDITNSSLKCALSSGISWSSMTVDSGNVGQYTSLAFLPSDQPAISYYAMSGQNLKYAWFDGSQWQVTIVEQAPATGAYTSLAISPLTGQPAISYTGNDDLRYAWFDGSAWHPGIVVDGEGDVGYYTSLTFLPSGKPAISYWNSTDGSLKYAELVGENPSDPNEWQATIIDSEGNVGQYTSIAVWNGLPAISYYDVTNKNLKFAWFGGLKWWTTIVDDGQNTGTYSSLAIISGRPAISYYSAGDLKYAELVGSSSANPDVWEITIVDTGGGTYTSLATMLSGDPAIGYYHAGSGDLKYACRYSE